MRKEDCESKNIIFGNEGNGVGREMMVETGTQEELDVKLRRNEKDVLPIYVICLVLWTRKAAHVHFREMKDLRLFG